MSEHPRLHSIPGGRDDRARRQEPATDREPLWREVLGQRLRTLREQERETLVETAGRAGISPQYLSEVERGRKEPSSEMIAALAGALGTTLGRLTGQVAEELQARELRAEQVRGRKIQHMAAEHLRAQSLLSNRGTPSLLTRERVDLIRPSAPRAGTGPTLLALAA